jgi:hypothetical protein
MDFKTKLEAKQSEYAGLARMMQLHADKRLPPEQAAEVSNLQFKLEFRLLELEELGWDAKIESAKKVLRILQAIK